MLPCWLSGKELACSAEEAGDATVWIPELVKSPGRGNCNSLQCSCWENAMDIGAWWAAVCRVIMSGTWLSDWARTLVFIVQDSSFNKIKIALTLQKQQKKSFFLVPMCIYSLFACIKRFLCFLEFRILSTYTQEYIYNQILPEVAAIS